MSKKNKPPVTQEDDWVDVPVEGDDWQDIPEVPQGVNIIGGEKPSMAQMQDSWMQRLTAKDPATGKPVGEDRTRAKDNLNNPAERAYQLGKSVLSGRTLTLSDPYLNHLAGGINTITGEAAKPSVFDVGDSTLGRFKANWGAALEDEKRKTEEFRDAHPYINAGAQIYGGMAKGGLADDVMSGLAKKAEQWMPTVKGETVKNAFKAIPKGAVVGAASAGVATGASNISKNLEGDLTNPLENVPSSITLGTLIGGGIPALYGAGQATMHGGKYIYDRASEKMASLNERLAEVYKTHAPEVDKLASWLGYGSGKEPAQQLNFRKWMRGHTDPVKTGLEDEMVRLKEAEDLMMTGDSTANVPVDVFPTNTGFSNVDENNRRISKLVGEQKPRNVQLSVPVAEKPAIERGPLGEPLIQGMGITPGSANVTSTTEKGRQLFVPPRPQMHPDPSTGGSMRLGPDATESNWVKPKNTQYSVDDVPDKYMSLDPEFQNVSQIVPREPRTHVPATRRMLRDTMDINNRANTFHENDFMGQKAAKEARLAENALAARKALSGDVNQALKEGVKPEDFGILGPVDAIKFETGRGRQAETMGSLGKIENLFDTQPFRNASTSGVDRAMPLGEADELYKAVEGLEGIGPLTDMREKAQAALQQRHGKSYKFLPFDRLGRAMIRGRNKLDPAVEQISDIFSKSPQDAELTLKALLPLFLNRSEKDPSQSGY